MRKNKVVNIHGVMKLCIAAIVLILLLKAVNLSYISDPIKWGLMLFYIVANTLYFVQRVRHKSPDTERSEHIQGSLILSIAAFAFNIYADYHKEFNNFLFQSPELVILLAFVLEFLFIRKKL